MENKAKKAALYTEGAYIITVIFLMLPYLIVPQTDFWIYISLGVSFFSFLIGLLVRSIFGAD